jgi:hypothetical protein
VSADGDVRRIVDVDVHALGLPKVGTLYSNFDHEYEDVTVDAVFTGKGLGQHAAWEYCGWVWFADGFWLETVYRYHMVVATYACADMSTLIDHVMDEHGRE